jgi:hypothetical protein
METPSPRSTPIEDPDIELFPTTPHLDNPHTTVPEFSLPPVDGGKDAWLLLFSAFVLEILVWGTYFHLILTQPL